MSEELFLLVSFSTVFVSMVGGSVPFVGRFLVLSRFAGTVLVLATAVLACALIAALSLEMNTRLAVLIAAGVAPLHQLLLLRSLYQRFVAANGRLPQFVSRFAPKADRSFFVSNVTFGVLPYAVLALIFTWLKRL